MSDDRKQPTPIDADEYDRFKQFVNDVHGATQNHLREEIENALREYRESYYGQEEPLARIEHDVALIKSWLAEESDGGTTLSEPESTHRDERTEAPHPKASRSKKVEWVLEQIGDYPEILLEKDIRGTIRDEWDFTDETVDTLAQRVVEKLDRPTHPRRDDLYLSEDRFSAVTESIATEAGDDAAETMATLDDAEPET